MTGGPRLQPTTCRLKYAEVPRLLFLFRGDETPNNRSARPDLRGFGDLIVWKRRVRRIRRLVKSGINNSNVNSRRWGTSMNTTDIIRETTGMTGPESRDLAIAIMKYVMKMCSHAQFKKENPDISAAEMRSLQEAVMSDYDIIVRAKLGVMHALRHGKLNQAFGLYGVEDPDLIQAVLALDDRRFLDMKQAACAAFRDEPYGGERLPTLLEHDRECAEAICKVRPHIRNFVMRKMRFIGTSNNYDKVDSEHDLLEKATRTFYLNRPFRSYEHVLNSMRRSVNNYGLNRIAYFQASKRRRLSDQKDGPVHENAIVSMYRTTSGGELSDSTGVLPEVERAHGDVTPREMEAVCWVGEISRMYERKQPLKHRAVNLMLGREDPSFVDYVSKRHRRFADVRSVEECRERMTHPVFFDAIRGYLDVTEDSFGRFVEGLKRQITYA